jgi:hypothetical protein
LVRLGGRWNLQIANGFYDQVIGITTDIFGADDPEVAATVQNKANALCGLGGAENLHSALPLYDQAITIFTKALGADHPEVAMALQNKATALRDLGGAENLLTAVSLGRTDHLVAVTAEPSGSPSFDDDVDTR